MSQINDFLERMADIAVGVSVPGLPIPYVLGAEPYQPDTLNSDLLPMVVMELMGGDSDIPISSGQQYRNTMVAMMLAVQRNAASTNLKYSVRNTASWVDGFYSAFAQHVQLSAPAKTIVSSTNASPIQITTATPHRYTTGQQVTIAGHLVNTNANGPWNVTVIDAWRFTIPAVGNGAGGQTGTARLTQPQDMGNIIDCVIKHWDLVDYIYGDGNYAALKFDVLVREMYVTSIQG